MGGSYRLVSWSRRHRPVDAETKTTPGINALPASLDSEIRIAAIKTARIPEWERQLIWRL
jgi:hypothetical protein